MLAFILDDMTDSDKEYVQDICIAKMYYAYEIKNSVASERYSPCERIRGGFIGGLFGNSIARIDADIRRNLLRHNSTQGRSEQQLTINSMGKLDHQSIHWSKTEKLAHMYRVDNRPRVQPK